MDKTLEPSLLKVSSEKTEELSQNATQNSESATKTITLEEATQYKGRIPSGVRDQVVAINEQKRQEKRQFLRKDKNNAIVQQKKVDAFLEEFLKNGGNATEAAMQVFNVSSRASASTIGSVYLKKAKVMSRIYLEQKGYSYGKLLTIAAQKAEESRLPDWWDRVMGVAGYDNPGISTKGIQGVTANINILQQREKDLFNKYTVEVEDGEIIEGDELQEEPDGA